MAEQRRLSPDHGIRGGAASRDDLVPALAEVFREHGFMAIIHLGRIRFTQSTRNRRYSANVVGTARLLRLALRDDPWGHGNSLEWATSSPPPAPTASTATLRPSPTASMACSLTSQTFTAWSSRIFPAWAYSS